ncbi:MAG: hypothetical protein J6F30_02025, partial [Cellulosilyticum sp.]|nr:hypothetical protein [Cellulosilyticum sp.]
MKNHIEYEYDALNRETKEARNNQIFTSTSYDANGNITNKQTISNGQAYLELSYEYNQNNSLIKETKKQLGSLSTKAYQYNENDELISTSLTKGNEVVHTKYVMTLDGKVSEVTDGKTSARKEYNEANQLVKSYHDGHTFTYQYDENGNRTLEKRDVGATRSYEYDEWNRLIALKDYDGAYYEYTYDGLDHRIKQYSIRHGQHYIDGEYIIEDKMDKLINHLKVATSTEYKDLCLVAYYHDEEVPELPKETQMTSYSTYQEKIGEEISYHGELGICLIHDIDVAEIVYVNDYTYTHEQVLSEIQGERSNNYVFGNGRISSDKSEYIEDYASSILMTLNHNGSIKAEYEYTDYGRRENVYDIYNYQDEAIGYNGEYHESSELIHLRARYYDPSDYSFISEDSYRGNLNDPSSRNRYLYGRSNPKKYIDPSGHYLNVNYQMTDSGSGRGSKVPKPSSTIIKPSQVNTPAIVNPYYYHSQVSSTPQRYTDSGSEQRAYQNTRSYIQARQEEKYSYQKGGNTSVVTAAEAKKEAVQVYKDIRQTTKEVIEPQTKKYTTT